MFELSRLQNMVVSSSRGLPKKVHKNCGKKDFHLMLKNVFFYPDSFCLTHIPASQSAKGLTHALVDL